MKPLDHLKELMREQQRKRYPSIAEHQLPIPNVWQTAKPEKRELKRICAYINLCKGVAQITNSSAKRVDNRTSYTDGVGFTRTIGSVEYRRGDLRPGTSDITATWQGKSWAIELKRIYKNGKDRQSDAQKDFQRDWEASGGVYVIVNSFEDFYERYGIY